MRGNKKDIKVGDFVVYFAAYDEDNNRVRTEKEYLQAGVESHAYHWNFGTVIRDYGDNQVCVSWLGGNAHMPKVCSCSKDLLYHVEALP